MLVVLAQVTSLMCKYLFGHFLQVLISLLTMPHLVDYFVVCGLHSGILDKDSLAGE